MKKGYNYNKVVLEMKGKQYLPMDESDTVVDDRYTDKRIITNKNTEFAKTFKKYDIHTFLRRETVKGMIKPFRHNKQELREKENAEIFSASLEQLTTIFNTLKSNPIAMFMTIALEDYGIVNTKYLTYAIVKASGYRVKVGQYDTHPYLVIIDQVWEPKPQQNIKQ